MIHLLHILKRQKGLLSSALMLIVLSCSQQNDIAEEPPGFESLLMRFQQGDNDAKANIIDRAVVENRCDQIASLVHQGARLDTVNEAGGNPLTEALLLDHYACADAIITSSSPENNGIDWKEPDDSEDGSYDIVELAINYSSPPEIFEAIWLSKLRTRKPNEEALYSRDIASSNRVDLLKVMVKHGLDLSRVFEDGYTLRREASEEAADRVVYYIDKTLGSDTNSNPQPHANADK
ncbi:hypothetical protein [Gynuella sunshinyii]|uniref:Ankyrin repeat n=1 Tax=Gynuella sunshinyii YC6258 TaxID=1445510 RepID=A0A0C5VMW7_9GAMM|nr:hypothetical protein [Gynuella sunshinyii]AJQ96072.1 hypothetical Protein YC6258_04036 [Gynuella sunshinyii YC6258]